MSSAIQNRSGVCGPEHGRERGTAVWLGASESSTSLSFLIREVGLIVSSKTAVRVSRGCESPDS